VTTIADALALADGVHVARFNNGSWSITARGFNGTTPNKLLVMVDGRIDYSPLFTGVFWDLLDYVLEDVERIEINRGPSATMWGANAINGVVNIITRNARETHGTVISSDTKSGGTSATGAGRSARSHSTSTCSRSTTIACAARKRPRPDSSR
jgi:iron complex outermembrane recepter protein